MTWLLWLNYYVFCWTWFRLARVFKDGRQIGWTIVGPMSPFAGWYESTEAILPAVEYEYDESPRKDAKDGNRKADAE